MTAGVPFAERGGTVRGLIDLVTGCYPAFLFGGSTRSVLPVFHFHEVTREGLEPRLQYLVENGYRTVTSDEIARLVIDGTDPGPRVVGLTFDDAWASVWTVVMPLLRQFGLRAIVFAIPGRVHDAASVRPTITSGVATADGDALATWPELRAMHESGVIDIQSHTRSHAMMFSGDTLVGFVDPMYANEPLLSRPLTTTNGQAQFLEAEALGTPLYPRRSRMSDATRFIADENMADRCRAHVARHGGSRFFERTGWRSELEVLVSRPGGRFESEADRLTSIRTELAEGRAMLNDQLRTKTVRHVALPWGIAGEITRQTLRDTGHEMAFAERLLTRRGLHAGDDRYQLTRLNGKFLTCLPGRGRQWFFTAVRT
jgi:hypothetical protein